MEVSMVIITRSCIGWMPLKFAHNTDTVLNYGCSQNRSMTICVSMQVVSVYLFHELPESSRRKVISEMARVLKPGGMAILTDGSQLGDRPILDDSIGNFQAFNEPNWGTHISSNYGAHSDMLPAVGVVCEWSCITQDLTACIVDL